MLLPATPGTELPVGLPLVLPMGWAESPPAFCTAAETVADPANNALEGKEHPPRHCLEVLAETPPSADDTPLPTMATHQSPAASRGRKFSHPVQAWDVHVGNFLGLAQGDQQERAQVKRVLLHSLDQVLRPPQAGDQPGRQEPASVKKLCKGDTAWTTQKTMLGWDLDTVQGTLLLPPH